MGDRPGLLCHPTPPMRESNLTRTVDCWLPVAIFGALPTVGLIAGPSYAPLVFGLAVVQLLHGLGVRREWPHLDSRLLRVALAFLAICWASTVWSIVPRHSLLNAIQMTGIVAAVLVFLSQRPLPAWAGERLFQVLLFGAIAGAVVVTIDRALGYPIVSFVTGRQPAFAYTKYNRGIDYLVLIAWPGLAWLAWQRQWQAAMALAAAVVLALMMGASLAGRVAALAGAVVALLAWWLPRLVQRLLLWGTVAFVVTLPLALRLVTINRPLLVPYLKNSAVNRLEIWDYTTARIIERPLFGWGLASGSSVPIHPEELASYQFVTNIGTYSHNQLLQLWLELGACGALCGLSIALVVLSRMRSMPRQAQPFAYAAFTSAMVIACINFEVTTDSWWAALAASGFLFMTLGRYVTHRSEA